MSTDEQLSGKDDGRHPPIFNKANFKTMRADKALLLFFVWRPLAWVFVMFSRLI